MGRQRLQETEGDGVHVYPRRCGGEGGIVGWALSGLLVGSKIKQMCIEGIA